MSQWGAIELARMGKDRREILEFYFPGTELSRFAR
jgi:SpoIID/LytB domain protein